MNEIKNAVIINGTVHTVKRLSYAGMPVLFDPCERCSLKRRCENSQSNFCAPFERKGYVPYFVTKNTTGKTGVSENK
jgi:hypothetical protein